MGHSKYCACIRDNKNYGELLISFVSIHVDSKHCMYYVIVSTNDNSVQRFIINRIFSFHNSCFRCQISQVLIT